MKKLTLLLGVVLLSSTLLARPRGIASETGLGAHGDWIGSGGFGMTMAPTLVLLSPQLEYVQRPNLLFGPLVQLAIGDVGLLFTMSATARMLLGHHPNLKPTIEAGLGVAVASNSDRYFSSGNAAGILIHFGMGFDYLIDSNLALGTMIRACFAPPLDTFFLSWPLLVGRFRF